MEKRIISNPDKTGRWTAWRDDYEAVKSGDALMGFGATEAEAMLSLVRQETRLEKEARLTQCDVCGEMKPNCVDLRTYCGDTTACEECRDPWRVK